MVGGTFALHHGNFAGLPGILAAEGVEAADFVLADLGMSSMQVDDAGRGFSYVRDGPLDMRMDRTRGRTAAQILAAIPEDELARAHSDAGLEVTGITTLRGPVRVSDAAAVWVSAPALLLTETIVPTGTPGTWGLLPTEA